MTARDDEPLRRVHMTTLPLWQRLEQAERPTYLCPGEAHPISRAVHLSRLAAFYPPCRHCPRAGDVGAIPRPQPTVATAAPVVPAPAACLARDGVRGVYLNELTRERAAKIAERIAVAVWDGIVRRGGGEDDDAPPYASPVAPTIVVGRDARPSSPDLAAGVVPALRRMGCPVVDVGCVSRPAIDFAVHHLRTAAGVYVTGAGLPPAVTGLDVVGADGVPWSAAGSLKRIADSLTLPAARPTRLGGALHTFDVTGPHRTDFARRLTGLRRARVGVAAECPIQQRQLTDWFAPCGGWIVPLPELRGAGSTRDWERSRRRHWRQRFQQLELTFAVLIAEDGRQVRVWDEQARLLPADAWFVRLAEFVLAGAAERRIVVSPEVPALTRGRLQALGAEVRTAPRPDHEALVRTLLATPAHLATDGAGRVWLREHSPVCDGMATTAVLLHLADHSPGLVSHWAA